MRNKIIRNITFAAMFAAMASILKIFSIQITPNWRISIFPIPIILASYYLGPIYGLLVGFATDTAYIIYSPYASFYSIYTLSTMIWGLTGYFIKLCRSNFLMMIVIIAITSILETSINTLGMLIDYKFVLTPVLANLPKRLITLAIRLPFLVAVTKILTHKLKVMELDFSWM